MCGVVVRPQFESALYPRQHLVVGQFARVASRAHVPLGLLVQQLQDLGVPGWRGGVLVKETYTLSLGLDDGRCA